MIMVEIVVSTIRVARINHDISISSHNGNGSHDIHTTILILVVLPVVAAMTHNSEEHQGYVFFLEASAG